MKIKTKRELNDLKINCVFPYQKYTRGIKAHVVFGIHISCVEYEKYDICIVSHIFYVIPEGINCIPFHILYDQKYNSQCES